MHVIQRDLKSSLVNCKNNHFDTEVATVLNVTNNFEVINEESYKFKAFNSNAKTLIENTVPAPYKFLSLEVVNPNTDIQSLALNIINNNFCDNIISKGSIGDNSGQVVGSGSDIHKYTENYIPIVDNYFMVSCEASSYLGLVKAYLYDENKEFLETLNIKTTSDSDTYCSKRINISNENAKYMRIRFHSSDGKAVDVNKVMINLGDKFKEYEDQKVFLITTPSDFIMRNRNNVSDELNILTKTLTKRISDDGEILDSPKESKVAITFKDRRGQTVDEITTFNDSTFMYTNDSNVFINGYSAITK